MILANILHLCTDYDPAGDVVPCVTQLKQHSRFCHELVVAHPNPRQRERGYPEPALMEWNTHPDLIAYLLGWADGVLYHFTDVREGWTAHDRPIAFRSLSIYYDAGEDRFYTQPEHRCQVERFKLLSASHLGARDFLPDCRFLPDLIPIFDALYTPDYSERPHCVAYIKHAQKLNRTDLEPAKKLSLERTLRPVVMWRRKTQATVVVDNVCDGHYGLAGCEALSLGLPCVVYNHPVTAAQLADLAPEPAPFVEAERPTLADALSAVRRVLEMDPEAYGAFRRRIRHWTERYYAPQRLIERYWDPFFEELLS